ncbi:MULTISPECIES: hypothetical protein [Klebsiella/Raoultella group]|uniref:hypothetical protein n=1 Tax=Klebsiella/Raoultella group TaxID=2890311 RepID=UPI000D747811|nr:MULTISPECIES: hypothetical protein [Klebsiella/Raoultella group]PXH43007.1 hypothetical protein DMQ64_15770 [Klebsiella pneumoniae]WKL86108.1 hypothetical protein Q1L34_12170 [Raoultella ornithinolytica]HBU3861012.1 hypothetical protein [Klebsiella pneumoniae]
MQKRRKWTQSEIQFVCENAGKMTAQEMAEKLNRSRQAICSQANRWGLSVQVQTAEDHDIYLCRELYKEGLTIPVIAEKMELSLRAVSNIVYSGCY